MYTDCMSKILIATPCYNSQVHSEMAKSILAEVLDLQKNNHSVQWDTTYGNNIAHLRNIAAHHALEDGFDWLVFWDADISTGTRGTIRNMIATAFRLNSSIVGAAVRLKTELPIFNYAFKGSSGYKNAEPNESADGVVRCDVIGTGLMLIKVDLLRKMQFPFFEFTETYNGLPGTWPEDWNFCEKAQHYTSIIADETLATVHWGQKGYA